MKFNVDDAPGEGRVEFPKVDLQKDETARACILSRKGWEVTVRHWVKGLGYVHCLALAKAKDVADLLKIEEEVGRPDQCVLCKQVQKGNSNVGAPLRRFAIYVLRYKTEFSGRFVGGGLKYWLEVWLIDNRKYRTLRKIMEEWGDLAKRDLAITCTDQQYQNMTIQPLKKAAWMSAKDEVKEYLRKELPKINLMTCLGTSMSAESLERRFLIMGRKDTTEKPVGLAELDELNKEVEGGAAATSEKDVFDFEAKEESDKVPSVEKPKVGEEEEADFITDLLKD